jgi:hypothetical protein
MGINEALGCVGGLVTSTVLILVLWKLFILVMDWYNGY